MADEPSETSPLVAKDAPRLAGAALRVRLLTAVASVAEGYDLGVINGAVVLMRRDLNLSAMELGWAVAIFFFAALPSVLLAGWLTDRIGRRGAVCTAMLTLALGNLSWAAAWHFPVLLLGRGLLGSGVAMGLTTVTVYVSEMAPAHQRGFYTALEPFFIDLGLPIGFASGVVFVGLPYDWRIMVGIGAIPAMLAGFLVMTSSFPESPRYLAATGRSDEAEKVLFELLKAGGVSCAEEEAAAAVEDWRSGLEVDGTCSWLEALKTFGRSRRRMALAGVGIGCVQMFSGITIFTAFSTLVLTENGMSTLESLRVTVGIGVAKMVLVLYVASSLLDRWGRRPLLLLSASSMAVSSLFIAAACELRLGAHCVALGLLLFGLGFSFGLGPATPVYMAEVFDTRTRSKGVSLGFLCGRMVNGIYTLAAPVVIASVGEGPVFVFLAVMSTAAVAYCYAFCPETKGQSLEEISRQLS